MGSGSEKNSFGSTTLLLRVENIKIKKKVALKCK
jgi:hypothetical protein